MTRPNLSLACVLGVIAAAPSANAELLPNGVLNDEQTSIVYYPETGEVAIDAPASRELTSVYIESAAGIFTGESAQNLGGSFADLESDRDIAKSTFGSSFGSLSFGNVAQAGLSQDYLLRDLTVVGSLVAHGFGDNYLAEADLVYMHELLPGDADRNLRCDQLDFV